MHAYSGIDVDKDQHPQTPSIIMNNNAFLLFIKMLECLWMVMVVNTTEGHSLNY